MILEIFTFKTRILSKNNKSYWIVLSKINWLQHTKLNIKGEITVSNISFYSLVSPWFLSYLFRTIQMISSNFIPSSAVSQLCYRNLIELNLKLPLNYFSSFWSVTRASSISFSIVDNCCIFYLSQYTTFQHSIK